jgi:predicted nucleic-acid-binding protein
LATVDTNVVVRLLVADDAIQSNQVRHLILRAERRSERLYVPLAVTLELEWVLRSHFEFAKDRVVVAFNSLLGTWDVEFQEKPTVEEALATYERHRIDFAECLHLDGAAAAARLPLLTFDRRAARVPGVASKGE